MSAPTRPFAFWLDRPFVPGRPLRRRRRSARGVTIRCRGSIGRSTVKALIVIALLGFLSGLIGERTTLNLDANAAATRSEYGVARR